jgi:hypothetical protein
LGHETFTPLAEQLPLQGGQVPVELLDLCLLLFDRRLLVLDLCLLLLDRRLLVLDERLELLDLRLELFNPRCLATDDLVTRRYIVG